MQSDLLSYEMTADRAVWGRSHKKRLEYRHRGCLLLHDDMDIMTVSAQPAPSPLHVRLSGCSFMR